MARVRNPSLWDIESRSPGIQVYSLKIKTRLGYLRPCLKVKSRSKPTAKETMLSLYKIKKDSLWTSGPITPGFLFPTQTDFSSGWEDGVVCKSLPFCFPLLPGESLPPVPTLTILWMFVSCFYPCCFRQGKSLLLLAWREVEITAIVRGIILFFILEF